MFKHGFPPEWSTLKKLIWLVGSGIAGAASGIWKTVTGTLLHLTDALASPMQKCEVTLEPVQAGSGDPSPDNVRPITGWTGCDVWVKDEYDTTLPATASVTFPDSAGTVYGGTVDLVSGVLKSKMASVDLGTLNWTRSQLGSAGHYFFYYGIYQLNAKYYGDVYADIFKGYTEGVTGWDYPDNSMIIGNSTAIPVLYIRCDTYQDAASFKTAMSGVQLVYELAEPIEIQLTPQQISTLRGENNVWGDGNIELTYKAQAE